MDLHDHEVVAENYDRYTQPLGSEESQTQFVDFHLQLANDYGQNGILDIACGTGNIAIPLAQSGHAVHAFDVSEAMIRRFRIKIGTFDEAVRSRIEISVQNMIDFSFERRFSLAMIPASGFMHVTTPEDQRQALENIHDHLMSGGVLTFNTFDPSIRRIAAYSEDERNIQKRTEFLSGNGRRMEIHESTTYDAENQLIKSMWLFREYGEDGAVVKETEVPMTMRYLFRQETKYLLELAGFAVEHLYGGYDRRDASYPSWRLVWVARKQ